MKEKRTRNWATIIYPRMAEGEETTCPDDWCDIVAELGVKVAVSPLHDKDVTSDGKPKKPHRHILMAFDGVKSEGQVRELVKRIGGVGCEPINSLYAQVRYLTHMDNPDKAQYSSLDVLTFGGFEYKRYASTKEDEEKECVSNMTEIFRISAELEIYDFATMAEYLISERPELFSTMRKNSYFFATFLKCKQNLACQLKEENVYMERINLSGLHNQQKHQQTINKKETNL